MSAGRDDWPRSARRRSCGQLDGAAASTWHVVRLARPDAVLAMLLEYLLDSHAVQELHRSVGSGDVQANLNAGRRSLVAIAFHCRQRRAAIVATLDERRRERQTRCARALDARSRFSASAARR